MVATLLSGNERGEKKTHSCYAKQKNKYVYSRSRPAIVAYGLRWLISNGSQALMLDVSMSDDDQDAATISDQCPRFTPREYNNHLASSTEVCVNGPNMYIQ